MDSLPQGSGAGRDDRYEIAGVTTGLLGHVASPRDVQLVATHGMLSDRTENLVVADVALLGYTPRMPADATVSIDGQPFRPVGTLSFIAPGVSVTLRGSGPFTSSACLLGPGFLAGLAETESRLLLEDIDFIRSIESERLTYLGSNLFREAIAPGFGGGLFAEAIGIAIALEIARYGGRVRGNEGPRRGGLASWQMRRLDSYIRANLSSDLTLDELARLLGMSVRHLSRAVKQEKGVSVHRWIAEFRLQEARRLLAETDSPIHEIARRSAFHSASAFTTAFRAASGYAPGEFRRLTIDRA
jgi:AraC family transcriptional regulator